VVVAEALIFLVVVALLLRRDLCAIARYNFQGGWRLFVLVAGLFALQALTVLYVPGQSSVQVVLLLLSQVGLLLLVLLNRHLPGALIFATGVALNTIVMVANGGWMPITPEMYQFVHPDRVVDVQARAPSSKGIILPREQTNLWFLSDIVPVALPWRRTAVSVGDLLLIAGSAQFIFQGSTKRRQSNVAPVAASADHERSPGVSLELKGK